MVDLLKLRDALTKALPGSADEINVAFEIDARTEVPPEISVSVSNAIVSKDPEECRDHDDTFVKDASRRSTEWRSNCATVVGGV